MLQVSQIMSIVRAAEVRTALTKGGLGKVAESGSVLFSFRRQGLVRVGPGHTEDEVRGHRLTPSCARLLPSWAACNSGSVVAPSVSTFVAACSLALGTSPCLMPPHTCVQVFEAAMDAGAEDVEAAESDEDGVPTDFKVYTQPTDFMQVYFALERAGLQIRGEDSALVYVPQSPVAVDGENAEQNEMLLDRLLAVDDVDAVYTSFV